MEVMDKKIPSKEQLTEEALKYTKAKGELAFSKGVRRGILLSLPFVKDYFKGKIEKLIK